MAYASQPADLIYNLTKAMIANYDAYKDAAPGAAGLELKRQNLAWVMPYHEGAVKALKEAGAWKAEHEAHNQKLLKRQETLAAAWAAFLKSNPPDDKDAFAKAWMAARKAALTRCRHGSGVRIVRPDQRRAPPRDHPGELVSPPSDKAGAAPALVSRRPAAARVEFADPHAAQPARSRPRSRACAGSPASGAGC